MKAANKRRLCSGIYHYRSIDAIAPRRESDGSLTPMALCDCGAEVEVLGADDNGLKLRPHFRKDEESDGAD